MKVFVGRSQSLWVVHPENGKVRKLPLSLGTLVGATVSSIAAASLCLAVIAHTGLKPHVWIEFAQRSVEAVKSAGQSEELRSVISRLQQEREEARRLNSRLASKLQNLEGALGTVTDTALNSLPSSDAPKSTREKSKPSSNAVFKPASFLSNEPLDQRRAIKKVDTLVSQLKDLPLQPPVENPIITSTYGGRLSPNGIGSSFHHGIDFSLRNSTHVLATGGGIVQTVGFMNGYGLYIDLAHQPGIVTRYAHLESSLVREGQHVSAGQLIAQGGASGTATGRHLHYEVLVNGHSQDPMLFLKLPQKLQFALKNPPGRIG